MKKICLTIAGSDSSGGAGIQADIKSMSANGVFAMSILTVLTAQNSTGVSHIEFLSNKMIETQFDSLFTDYEIDTVKIGALGNSRIIDCVYKKLKQYKPKNIILDPVMIASSGANLLEDAAIDNFQKLMEISSLVTPNKHEAEKISGIKIQTLEDQERVGKFLVEKYKTSFLVKGGHINGDSITDLLIREDKSVHSFNHKKINTTNTHGTGCSLSSAIAANMAKGLSLESSVKTSIDYIQKAIENSLDIGNGVGPLDHFFDIK